MNHRNIVCSAVVGLILTFSLDVKADSVYVAASGNVGFGTDAPIVQMDVIGSDASVGTANTTALYLTNESATVAGRVMLALENNGTTRFSMNNTSLTGARWVFAVGINKSFRISKADTAVVEFEVTPTGDVNAQGTFNTLSDRNSKRDIEPLNSKDILGRVVALPLSSWSYKDEPGISHVGPMAQDFYAAFKLGNDNKAIASIDASGVALAAIQGLYNELEAKEERIQALESKIESQEELMARISALEEVAVKMMLMQEASGLKTRAVYSN